MTVVDTSANYTGGSSERLVGDVINRWQESGESKAAEGVVVVSKFGYASVSITKLHPFL